MKILAIDTSQKSVSAALLADDGIRAAIFISNGCHHSETLLPAIDEVFRLAGMGPGDMNLFAGTIGPGSFTGLRIGAATVKGLALATGKQAVGVSTLDALAWNAIPMGGPMICPMLDAQRGQVYTALYRATGNGGMEKILEDRIIDVEQWLQEREQAVFFLGDGAVRYRALIEDRFCSQCTIADGSQNHVRAEAVAVLARDHWMRGLQLDPLTFAPRYLRPSEAERSMEQETEEIDKPPEFR